MITNNSSEKAPVSAELSVYESGEVVLQQNTSDGKSKTNIRMIKFQEVHSNGVQIGKTVAMKECEFKCCNSSEKKDLFITNVSELEDKKYAKGTTKSMTTELEDKKYAKGTTKSMTTTLLNIYTFEFNAHQVTESGEAGTKKESYHLLRDDFMFSIKLLKENQDDHDGDNGFVDIEIEMDIFDRVVLKVAENEFGYDFGDEFGYDFGDDARLMLTNRYYLRNMDGDDYDMKTMPVGFPKVTLGNIDRGKCRVQFRFEKFERQLFYDPWINYYSNQNGEFKVVYGGRSCLVNFGEGFSFTVNTSLIKIIKDAMENIDPPPKGNIDKLYFEISKKVEKDFHKVLTTTGKDAGSMPLKVKHILRRAEFKVNPVCLKVEVCDPPEEDPNNAGSGDVDIEKGIFLMVTIKEHEKDVEKTNLYTDNNYQFESSKENYHSYEWDFGDNTNESGRSILKTHSYTEPGRYTVTLTAIHDDGENFRTKIEVKVKATLKYRLKKYRETITFVCSLILAISGITTISLNYLNLEQIIKARKVL